MQLLDQLLVAALNGSSICRLVEVQGREGPCRGAAVARALRLFGPTLSCAGLEDTERVGMKVVDASGLAGRPIDPHIPRRPMSDESLLLVFLHRDVAHAAEVIVGCVVLSDMIETETEVLPLVVASPRGAIVSCREATRVIARVVDVAAGADLAWRAEDFERMRSNGAS